jgi:hypothetical protein
LSALFASSSAGRADRNASDRPSGLQRGAFVFWGLVVSAQGGREPSAGTIQIAERRCLLPGSILVSTKANRLPSGEIRGSLTVSRAK